MIILLLTSLLYCTEQTDHPTSWENVKRNVSETMDTLVKKLSKAAVSAKEGVKQAAHTVKEEAQEVKEDVDLYIFGRQHDKLEEAIRNAKNEDIATSRAVLAQIGKDIKKLKGRIKGYTKSYAKRYPGQSPEKSNLIREAEEMLAKLELLRKNCEVHRGKC